MIIFVRDLEAAKDVYRDTLGFTVWPPPGESAILPSGFKFGGADFEAGSLEWRAIDDAEKAAQYRPRFVNFLEKHQGPLYLVLSVSSAHSTVAFLRTHGFQVGDPEPAPWMVEGTATPIWRAVTFKGFHLPVDPGTGETDASPTRAIAFVEWDASREERLRRSKSEGSSRHPNTARGIKSVWMAVRDLNTATKVYESIGLHTGRKRKLSQLNATGREIRTGQGVILLLQPQSGDGRVFSFLADRGEGMMGVSVEVSDLRTAHTLLETNTRRKFTPYAGPYGSSILIPAEIGYGVWIELFRGEGTT